MFIYNLVKVSPEGLQNVGLFYQEKDAKQKMEHLEKHLSVEDAFERNTRFIIQKCEVVQWPKKHQSKK